jgi:hypothetical protein
MLSRLLIDTRDRDAATHSSRLVALLAVPSMQEFVAKELRWFSADIIRALSVSVAGACVEFLTKRMSSRSVQTQVQALEALSNFTSRPGIESPLHGKEASGD